MPNFLDEDRDRIKELGRVHRHFTRLNLQTDSIVAIGALYALARRGLVPTMEKTTRTIIEESSAREIRHDNSRFGRLLTAWLEEPLSSLNKGELREILELFRIQKAFQRYGKEPLFAGWLYQFGILNDVSEKSYGQRRTGRRMDELAAITRWYTPSAIAEFIVDEALGEPQKVGSGRFIDPACGAGHLLIPAFQKLLKAGENPRALLEKRLFGLDIDRRAVQMAGFAVYLACRDAGLDGDLPIPKLFWFSSDSSKSTESNAALGSFLLGIPEEKRPGAIALSDLENKILPLDTIPSSYSHLAANPPYLSNRLMPEQLRAFLKEHYQDCQYDLYTAFIELSARLLEPGGRSSFICQNSFLNIQRYENFRLAFSKRCQIETLALLGPGSFATRSGEKVNSAILTFTRRDQPQMGTDNGSLRILKEGARDLEKTSFESLSRDELQLTTKSLPGHPIAIRCPRELVDLFRDLKPLGSPDFGIYLTNGLFTCNNKKFVKHFRDLELEKNPENATDYVPYDKGGGRKWHATTPYFLHWPDGGDTIREYRAARGQSRRLPGEDYYFRTGVTYSYIGTSGFTARLLSENAVFDIASSALFSDRTDILYLLGFLNSSLIRLMLGILNPTVNFQIGDLRKLPYIEPPEQVEKAVADLASQAVAIAKELERFDHQSPKFEASSITKTERTKVGQLLARESTIQIEINQIILDLYGAGSSLKNAIDASAWVKENSYRSYYQDLQKPTAASSRR